jgi:hypothetical protein
MDGAQELLTVEQSLGLAHERLQQLELREGQRDGATVDRDLAAAPVEHDRTRAEHLHAEGARTGPPQHRADAAAKLGDAEGLGDVVVGAGLQSQHRIGLAVAGGEHDDGHEVATPAQRAAHLEAVWARAERDVEEDHVEAVGAGPIDGRAAVGHGGDPVSIAGEGIGERAAQVGLVVDDQHVEHELSAHPPQR